MTIRLIAFALIAGTSVAIAAPPGAKQPKPTPPPSDQPADSIDVDAIARAKDGTPDQAPTDAVAPTAAPVETAPSEAPPADATPADVAPAAPAAAAENASPSPSASDADAAPAEGADPNAEEKSVAASCQARSVNLLDAAEKADYAGATRDFTAKMRTDLPVSKFRLQWESLGQFGKLEARGQSHLGRGDGYTLVMIPLIFEKANLIAQIACGTDGRVAGFHVTPAPKPAGE